MWARTAFCHPEARDEIAATAALAPVWRSLRGCSVSAAKIDPCVDNPAMAACREARPLVDDGLPASIRTDKLGRARGQLRCGGVHRQIDQVAHNLVERAPECGRVASEPASNQRQVAGPLLRARQPAELDARERRDVAAQQSSQAGVVKAGPARGFALWPRGECILSRALSPRASAVRRTAPAMSPVSRSSAA